MTTTRRPAFRGMLLGLGLITAIMSSGCDQVRQRLTPSATGQNTTPATPAASGAPSVTPSSPSAPPATATPAGPVAPGNPVTPTVVPTTPVERYSSHQGSSGVGPVERRQSSGSRP